MDEFNWAEWAKIHSDIFYGDGSTLTLPQDQETLKKFALAARMEQLEMVASYARDIVQAWDTVSFRTLRSLNDKVKGLKEALELLK